MPEQPTWPEAATTATTTGVPGDRIAGRYRLVAPLATGGMAQVWRAVDDVLARPVAVKILLPHLAADPSFVARFRREAIAAARLSHPTIVSIYDTCDAPESIVMELVEGHTLRDELDRHRFLPTDRALHIASGIAEALEAAHRAGIVHRDVKPGNVLLGGTGQLKVTDFGIAKAAREDPELPDLTQHGQLVGTAKYLAPEQVAGRDVDARTDVYALGLVLYEMLTGRLPFAGANDQAIAVARLDTTPPRPRSVLRTIPHRVDRLVMRALSRQPEDRFPTAAAFRAELLHLLDDHDDELVAPEPAPEDVDAEETPVAFARAERHWLVPAMLVLLVSVALGVAWLLIGGTEARRNLIGLVDAVTPGRIEDRNATEGAVVIPLRASSFDPRPGDGQESDGLLAEAVDNDPSTAWRTEQYRSRDLGNLKPGVGLVLHADELVRFEELIVRSDTNDWAAAVYVADTPTESLAAWGEPVASASGIAAGTTTFDLRGQQGRRVLLWITDLGDGVGVHVEIAEADVRVTR